MVSAFIGSATTAAARPMSAQEVQAVMADAVVRGCDGYLRVY
jgi:hypothetical protein